MLPKRLDVVQDSNPIPIKDLFFIKKARYVTGLFDGDGSLPQTAVFSNFNWANARCGFRSSPEWAPTLPFLRCVR